MKNRPLRYNLIFIFPYFLGAVAIALLSLFPFHALEVFADQPVSTELTDRHEKILRVLVLEDGTRRQYVPLKSISDETRHIFLMSEDRRFYVHPGVDPLALARGVVQLLTRQSTVSGGSTISMQLARMMRFSHTKYPILRRKLGEMVTAIRIEQKISKERILELWLNNLPFGSQVEGIGSAARMFYNRDLDQLSRAQIVSLALIPRNPTKYNPITRPQTVIERAADMVSRLDLNIPIDDIRQDIAAASWGRWPHEAEHFTRLVSGGLEENDTPQTLPTSLDLDFQLLLENRIAVHLDQKSDSRISNAAGLLIRNSTGEILAYAGSQDFNDTAFGGQIDGVQVRNQPGSTIKPFLFALAFENGYSPNDLLPDIPTDFGGTMIYVPRNFDERYHGPVRLRTALASSLNVPATALAADLGVKRFASFLLDFGFDSIESGVQGGYPIAGLGIALGNSPVSLFELVRGFSVFPRGGEYIDLSWHRFSDPADGTGKQRTRQVVSRTTADIVSHILMDPFERTLGFGMDDPFDVNFPVMVKTGTASRYQNIWALASAGDFTIGIWLGNFSGETVIGRTGSSVPASIALEVLAELPGVMNGNDRIPGDLIPLRICSVSGEKAGTNCTGSRIEYFREGSYPDLCSFHPEKEIPGYVSYPAKYLAWIDAYGRSGTLQYSNLLKIVSPADGSTFFYDHGLPPDMQALRILVMHDPEAPASLIVNGREIPERVPEKAGLSSWLVPLEPGKWTISAISAGRHIDQVLEVRP